MQRRPFGRDVPRNGPVWAGGVCASPRLTVGALRGASGLLHAGCHDALLPIEVLHWIGFALPFEPHLRRSQQIAAAAPPLTG